MQEEVTEDGRLARPFLSFCHPEAAESRAKRETPNEGPMHLASPVSTLSLRDKPLRFPPILPVQTLDPPKLS